MVLALTTVEMLQGDLEAVQWIWRLNCWQAHFFFFSCFFSLFPRKCQMRRTEFTSKVLIRCCYVKKATVGGCANADRSCELEEIQAEKAAGSLLLLLRLQCVHMNNKTE